MAVGGQRHAVAALRRGRGIPTQFTGDCVGPRACLDY
jgi:hypothetical protein